MLVSFMPVTLVLFTFIAAIDLDFSALDTLPVQFEVRGQLRALPPGVVNSLGRPGTVLHRAG
jgi:hypothetical protein